MKIILKCLLLVVSYNEFDVCTATQSRDHDNEEVLIRDYKLELSSVLVDFNVTFDHPVKDSDEPRSRIVFANPLVVVESVTDDGTRTLHVFNPLGNLSCRANMITMTDPFIDIAAKVLRANFNILAVAYQDCIELWSLAMDSCRSELLQTIRIDKTTKRIKLFHQIIPDRSEPVLYMIALKASSDDQDSLSVFNWLDSGFHLIDEKTIDECKANDLTLLDLSECHSPAIFIRQTYENPGEKAATGLVVYQVDSLGKLQLRQRLYFNRLDQFHAYTLSCDSFNFMVCAKSAANTSVCSVYSSRKDLLDFVEERKWTTHIGTTATEHISYTTSVALAWSRDMPQSGRVFLDDHLSRAIDIVGIDGVVGSQNLTDILVWSKEDLQIAVLAVYKTARSTNLRLAGLRLIESQPEPTSTDPLVSILQEIRGWIFVQKFLLDKITSLVTRKEERYNIARLQLNRTTVANGRVTSVTVKSRVFAMPSAIRDRLLVLQARIAERKVQREVHFKRLHVEQLECNRSRLYSGLRADWNSNRLIFAASTNVTVKKIHTTNIIKESKDEVLQQQHQQSRNSDSADPPLILRLYKNIKIDSIVVRYLNTINFTRMHENAFLRNRDRIINGTLVFRQQGVGESHEKGSPVTIHCSNLTAETLNQRQVKDLFTLKTDQEVNSNIVLSKFLVLAGVSVATLNGQSTSEIALASDDNTFKSPISIGQFAVSGDLILSADNEPNFVDRVRAAAAKVENFSQIYNGRVRISGRLTINNLETAATDTGNVVKMMRRTDQNADHHEIMDVGNLNELFWMKDTAQTIDTSVQFAMPIQARDLNMTTLNGHPISSYVQRSKFNAMAMTTNLLLKSVKIRGNLNTDLVFREPTENNEPDAMLRIEHVSANLVRRSGHDFAEISGKMHFTNPLKVSHLHARRLRSVPIEDLVRKGDTVHFRAPKTMKRLNVSEQFAVNDKFTTTWLNSYNLSKLFTDAVMIAGSRSAEAALDNVTFLGNVETNYLNVDYVNQHSVRESEKTLGSDKPLVIRGNVVFKGNLDVDVLNGVSWNHYHELLVLQDDSPSSTVGGRKSFLSNVSVSAAVVAETINAVDMSSFYQDVLKNSGGQTIRAPWRLTSPHITHLVAKASIDGVPATFLIRQDTNVNIRGDVKIAAGRLRGNVVGGLVTDSLVNDCLIHLRHMTDSVWSELRIRNNVAWPIPADAYERCSFEHIRNQAVRTDGSQNVLGRVRFRRTPKFRVVSLEHDLAGVNIGHIVADALTKDNITGGRYSVNGSKYFENSIRMDDSAEYRSTLDVAHINGVDILALNQSIYRKDSADIEHLVGHTKLSDRTVVRHLIVHGLINSMRLDQVFFIGDNQDLPPSGVRFTEQSSLIAQSLDIGQSNGIHWDSFLRGRVQLGGEGQTIHGYLTFEKMRTLDAVLMSINGVNLERVVYKEAGRHQIIYGSKTLANSLHIIGPSSILNLNGTDLIEKYRNSLFTDRNYRFETVQLVGAERIAFRRGFNIAGNFSQEATFLQTTSEELKKRMRLLDDRQESRPESLRLHENGGGKFLYLDYDHNARADADLSRNCSLEGCNNNCQTTSAMRLRKLKLSGEIVLQTSRTAQEEENVPTKFRLDFWNNCTAGSSRLRIEHYDEIDFPSTIENAWTIDSPSNDPVHHVLLEFQNSDRSRALCLLRMDSKLKMVGPVQEIRSSSKDMTGSSLPTTQLVRIRSDRMLVFASNNASLDVYKFQPRMGRFVKDTSFGRNASNSLVKLLSGDSPDDYQTIIGSYGERDLVVHYGAGQESFILQRIQVPDSVESLVTFEEESKSELRTKLLVVYTQKDAYYVYRYVSNVEGWVYETYGIQGAVTT